MRGHIAGTPRVGVVTPDSPDIPRLLKNHEVVDTVLLELNRNTDAGESTADDDR